MTAALTYDIQTSLTTIFVCAENFTWGAYDVHKINQISSFVGCCCYYFSSVARVIRAGAGMDICGRIPFNLSLYCEYFWIILKLTP